MKIILIIYLSMIAFYLLGLTLCIGEIVSTAKKEKLVAKKQNAFKQIRCWLALFLIGIIPIFNMGFGAILIFTDIYQKDILNEIREDNGKRIKF